MHNKKITTLLLLTTTLTFGCDKVTLHSGQTLNGSKEAADFIIECSKVSNTRSDEEGEDVVAQCEQTARNLYESTEYYIIRNRSRVCRTTTAEETKQCALTGLGYDTVN